MKETSALPIASGREFEVKLELGSDDFSRLADSPFLRASADPPCRKALRSIYFDTPGHDLRKAGIALRLRNDGGGVWVQTVKAGEEPTGGLADVAQIEVELSACEPDLERIADERLRRGIKKICKKADIGPIFETIVNRTTHAIRNSACTAELALDEGRVEADGRSSPFREAELELLSGSPQGLLAIARELFSDLRIRPSLSSKAGRGYRLLQGATEESDPLHAKEVTLKQGQTAREAFAAILQVASEQIIANQRLVLKTGEVEAVHQLRIGLTRLRSALRSIKPYSKAPWIYEIESDAQSLAKDVGRLRDADVLIAEIYTPVAEEGSTVPGFAELHTALKAHRDALHKEVVDRLDKGIWPRLLVTLILMPYLIEGGGELDEPVSKAAGKSLERLWKRVRHYGERIDSLNLEERHSMRKALKKLRYNCEFFQSLYGRDAESFIKRLKELQLLFGSINDVRMAQQVIQIALDHHGEERKSVAAAGYILGRHEAHMPRIWETAKRDWKRLEKAAGFWR